MNNRYRILKAETFDNTFTVEDKDGHQHYVTGISVTGKLENKDEDLVGKEFTATLVDYIKAASDVKFVEQDYKVFRAFSPTCWRQPLPIKNHETLELAILDAESRLKHHILDEHATYVVATRQNGPELYRTKELANGD